MDSAALALVFAGALFHAVWNLLAKRCSAGASFVWLYGGVGVVAGLPFAVACSSDIRSLGGLTWLAIVASGVIHLAYSLVLQRGYQLSELSVVYPTARGSGPLFTLVVAMTLMGERPAMAGWAGILAIIAGVILMSDLPSANPLRSARARRGIVWGVATGLTIAGYTLVDGWALTRLGAQPLIYYFLGLVIRSVLLAPAVLRDAGALASQWRRHGRTIVAVGILSPLAYAMTLLAMTRAPLVYVAAAREVAMLFGVVLGALVLREVLTGARVAGAACMLGGVTLLGFAG